VALPRWFRFITDRSQIVIIFGVLVVVVALFGFSELAVEKSAAIAALERAQGRVDQLEDQQARLTRALEQAQNGQRIAPKAYQYYGAAPPGVTVIIPEEPAIIPQSAPSAPDAPWSAWTAQVTQSFAEGTDRFSAWLQEMGASINQRLNP
jgi:hypothetical protein